MAATDDRAIRLEEVAVALRYVFGREGEAPRVVAAGRGRMAQRIVAAAREAAVPVREDKPLAESLIEVPVGTEIPPDLWELAAELLAQIYLLDGRKAAGLPR